MKKICFFLMVLAPSPALSLDLFDCLAIDAYPERVQCARSLGLLNAELTDEEETAPPATERTISTWVESISQSPIDDSTTVVLTQASKNTFRNPYGQSGRGSLIVRCLENTTSAYMRFNDHFMADIQGRGRVEYRIDDRPARSRNMNVSTDNMALGEWNGGESIPWIRQFFGGEELFVRAIPFNESAVSMTFDIRGLEDAIEPLREACNW